MCDWIWFFWKFLLSGLGGEMNVIILFRVLIKVSYLVFWEWRWGSNCWGLYWGCWGCGCRLRFLIFLVRWLVFVSKCRVVRMLLSCCCCWDRNCCGFCRGRRGIVCRCWSVIWGSLLRFLFFIWIRGFVFRINVWVGWWWVVGI